MPNLIQMQHAQQGGLLRAMYGNFGGNADMHRREMPRPMSVPSAQQAQPVAPMFPRPGGFVRPMQVSPLMIRPSPLDVYVSPLAEAEAKGLPLLGDWWAVLIAQAARRGQL